MNNKYVLTKLQDITTGFFFEDDKIEEIRCYEEDSLIGNIYVGKISNILKNINALFVDISKDETCYLSLEDYTLDKAPKLGQDIIVQITKDKIKTKQASVSMELSLTGKYIVVNTSSLIGVSSKVKSSLERERLKAIFVRALQSFLSNTSESIKEAIKDISFGGILRTDALLIDEQIIEEEAIILLRQLSMIIQKAKYSKPYYLVHEANKLYYDDVIKYIQCDCNVVTDIKELYDQILSDNNIEDKTKLKYHNDNITLSTLYSLNTVVRKALNKNVYLKSGAYLVIEPTEAMTVIDVNSGKAIKGNNKEDIALKINKEAALEISRQLKLRNMSGIIIVDFISMKTEGYNEILMDYLKKCVVRDKIPVSVIDITRLGLVEITRKKVRKPLYQIEKFRGIE
ncbi:MAG: ribonuclease E/G [Lachnospiraceae bacterium]|nr:ribonuclease E/G [Lachnospiraceae bacterium]